MKLEIKIPSVGESVQEAVLVEWYKKDGDNVQKDEPLFVVETDKVTLEIVAEASGVLKILISEGETVGIGSVVGTLDTEAAPAPPPNRNRPKKKKCPRHRRWNRKKQLCRRLKKHPKNLPWNRDRPMPGKSFPLPSGVWWPKEISMFPPLPEPDPETGLPRAISSCIWNRPRQVLPE